MTDLTDILNIEYTWTHFFIVVVVLILTYLLLIFLNKIVVNVALTGQHRTFLTKALEVSLIYYEPVAFVIAVSLFVMIKPALHGLFVGLLSIAAINHFRNYINGRILIGKRTFVEGQLIKVGDRAGIISEMGKLGIRMKSDDGLHYFPYKLLMTEGYTLSSGDKIGGYYHLDIRTCKTDEMDEGYNRLTQILISSPYLDGDHKTDISRSITVKELIHVKLLVKEERHIFDLITLLEENEFVAELSKS